MKTYTVTTSYGNTLSYQAGTQAEAIRLHTAARPSEGITGITEESTYKAHADTLASYAE